MFVNLYYVVVLYYRIFCTRYCIGNIPGNIGILIGIFN